MSSFVQVIQLYGIALVALGGTTLVMRVVGCFIYVAIQWYKFSPLIPPSWRRCFCIRSTTGFPDVYVDNDATVADAAPASRRSLQAIMSSTVTAAEIALSPQPSLSNPMHSTRRLIGPVTSKGGSNRGVAKNASIAEPAVESPLFADPKDNKPDMFRSFRANPLSAAKKGAAVGVLPRRPLVGDDGVPAQTEGAAVVQVAPPDSAI